MKKNLFVLLISIILLLIAILFDKNVYFNLFLSGMLFYKGFSPLYMGYAEKIKIDKKYVIWFIVVVFLLTTVISLVIIPIQKGLPPFN